MRICCMAGRPGRMCGFHGRRWFATTSSRARLCITTLPRRDPPGSIWGLACLLAQYPEAPHRITEHGAHKDVRDVVGRGGDAGEPDRAGQPVRHPGDPAVVVVAVRNYGC